MASGGELKHCVGCRHESKLYQGSPGPANRLQELSQAVTAGVIVNVESERELDRIADIGDALGITPRVAIRVNPDFEMKSSGMRMGGGAKQFGIDAELVPQILRRIGNMGVDNYGLHIFSGSQCLHAAAIMEAQSRTFELAIQLAQDAPRPPCVC